ncbi:hypothetical protein B296_00040635 [Ensete ventricosum]|uniref:Uncharacterized protein n=1 Tax=Ensete ventricosum TaxID=4639 RepID=A0A426XM03_ENSVE|nr:hypothetical protein B296_00040635 [Ensete ventricosum]
MLRRELGFRVIPFTLVLAPCRRLVHLVAKLQWLHASMLGQMSGDSELGLGGRLLEWWSSGREEVFQLGSTVDSCKKARSLYSGCCRSSVPGNPVALVTYPVVVRFHHARRPCGARDVARADPTEQELGNWDAARVGPTEQELGNCDVARADPTEQELRNCDVTRVDPTEQELRNYDVPRADPTEQEIGTSRELIRPSRNSGIGMPQELIRPSRSSGIVMSQELIRPSRSLGRRES